jgi:thiol-disulfide isomerase/thioredoxin
MNLKFNIIIFLIALCGCSNHRSPILTGLEGKSMPSFSLLLLDSASKLNTNEISSKKPISIFFISPHCPYCRAQTKTIIDNMNTLNNIDFYIITTFPFHSFKEYSKEFGLYRYKNITLAQDYNSFFPKYFNVTSIPYIAIYNKEKKLKQVFAGKVSAKQIKDAAFE